MASDFRIEDLVAETRDLPDFLRGTPEAERWLCGAIFRIRLKQCGREEISWLLGVSANAINDSLPSSADTGLFGKSLVDIGFLPRGSGCFVQECRSMAHLNGRKSTLCDDVRDGASHALVLVDGGLEVEIGSGDQSKTVQIARKNLEYASAPEANGSDGWPPLSLASQTDEEPPAARPPSEVLGSTWHDPSLLPAHLRGPDALVWLADVVGRLVDSKSCGREEIGHVLGFATTVGFGGVSVPPSVSTEHHGSLLEELTFVPEGEMCRIEGCNSRAHLNGRIVRLSQACPDGEDYARLDLGAEGELQMHRKNLRLVAPETVDKASGPQVGAGSSVTGEVTSEWGRSSGCAPQTENPPKIAAKEEAHRTNQGRSFWDLLFGGAYKCACCARTCDARASPVTIYIDSEATGAIHQPPEIRQEMKSDYADDRL